MVKLTTVPSSVAVGAVQFPTPVGNPKEVDTMMSSGQPCILKAALSVKGKMIKREMFSFFQTLGRICSIHFNPPKEIVLSE